MFDHPQVAANGLTAHMTLGDGTGYRGLSSPIAFGATPVAPPTGAPSLGEHSDQILTDAGFDAEAIAHLRSAGVVA